MPCLAATLARIVESSFSCSACLASLLSFSFSSSAERDDGHVEMSIRNLGDFTGALKDVEVGRRVYLDGPYGAFTIGAPTDMHVLVAGGIGITPMMSMIRTLADRGDTRPLVLLYGSKDWESTSFREELAALQARMTTLEQTDK